MRRRALASVRGWGIPDCPPFECARCGHWLLWGAVWFEHRTAGGRPVVRVHRICPPRAPMPGYPGYAVEVRHGTL